MPDALTQAANHKHHGRYHERERSQLHGHDDARGLVLGQTPEPAEEDGPSEEGDQHPEDGALVQRMSLRSMNLMASRHDRTANPIRNVRWPTSAQPSKPNTAWRTSSTQWYSGLTLPAI